ncbi:GDSL family lipase [Actinoplanes sp. SE50]|nr:lipolytic protein G-D-S-L family [Actinoplanes sp. SE50/110]ATO82981.1 GDSL family lipase [Actinoplanes sp. SE50]SLM00389.1 lipase [Actinoplanes sp. SE50/110]
MVTSQHASNHPTVVFYGDSIVTGWRGTTHPRARWSSLVSDELGWREVNLSINGMGYFRRRGPRGGDDRYLPSATDTTLLDAAIRLDPDAVIVCLAANDIRMLPEHADEVRAAIDRDLTRLRDELPGRPILVVTYYPVAELSERATLINNWVAGTAERLGLTYVDAFRRTVDGDEKLLCDDHTHPNDDGHRALADAILPACRALTLR